MPRCEQCTRFVSIEVQGEVGTVDLEGTNLYADLRLIKTCVECGDELEEYNESFETDLEEHHDCDGEMPVDNMGGEITYEPDEIEIDESGEGKGRWRKTYYHGTCEVGVKCNCGWEGTIPLAIKAQASHFDEL